MVEENNQNEIDLAKKQTESPKPSSMSGEASGPIVETFVGDMAGVIEGDKEGGLVKKIIHGEEEREQEKENLSPESKKNKVFMFIGFLLIFLALAVVSFLVYKNRPNTIPVSGELGFTPLVFSEHSAFLEVSGFKKDEVVKTVLNEISKNIVRDGGVEGIYLTENKQVVGLRRFITLISASFVPSDNIAFVNDNFLMGVVKNKGFFMLLKMRSPTDIFDSLRAWEPNLLSDLRGFLGVNINGGTNYLLTKSFEDGFIQNKNARILYDQNGNIVLMYIFADNNSVIVTGSEQAADEIILRLASNQGQ